MANLFDPITIGDVTIENRIIMAPLMRNRSPEAVPNELNVDYYRQRASAGLIISEATAITEQGQGYSNAPGLYSDAAVEGWRNVTKAVHEAGGKIFCQLMHVGRVSHKSLQPFGDPPVAPSALQARAKTFVVYSDATSDFIETSMPRALKPFEISGIIDDYRRAAARALEAGFDGVEIHAANGYLIDQFLRSGSNQRTDLYGGPIENRARFMFDVVGTISREIGPGRTAIRLSPVAPSNDVHDDNPQVLFNYLASQLSAYDLAYIHVIEGATGGDRNYSQGPRPFDYEEMRQTYYRTDGSGAWMLNNGYDRQLAIDALEKERADLISFGRAFIANPDLVRRLRINAQLNALDQRTLFGGDAKGYVDYPPLGG
ncbi:alkene reductase [Martelella mediterranea]|uniref:alkene reductase n=1 Tax=Martelella TaxID=293088 RepID=UPI000C6A51FC|nr:MULTISPECIES: alkene reductase [Martelella]MAU21558.1 alkene reductase [Martelella sp.]MCD1632819.1 alkene reductase [Martelella mediterranea]